MTCVAVIRFRFVGRRFGFGSARLVVMLETNNLREAQHHHYNVRMFWIPRYRTLEIELWSGDEL